MYVDTAAAAAAAAAAVPLGGSDAAAQIRINSLHKLDERPLVCQSSDVSGTNRAPTLRGSLLGSFRLWCFGVVTVQCTCIASGGVTRQLSLTVRYRVI